jgi:D-alanyl-D-alanine carboxypeptidase
VETRLPRPRPTVAEGVAVAYADLGVPSVPDSVAAVTAQAQSAPLPEQFAAPIEIPPATSEDPIAARIETATQLAELAEATQEGDTEGDPIAALASAAHERAGGREHPRLAEYASALPDGWHIQIGAVPTKEGAEALIGKARHSAGDLLAAAEPFTAPVEKDGSTLYRARFAGFSGKDEARETCLKLERKSFSCLAVPN